LSRGVSGHHEDGDREFDLRRLLACRAGTLSDRRQYWEPNLIVRVYRDARAQRFEEGTNEIQKAVIARSLFGG
jgi:alkylation response protein AidB-like acyl-CoA dehydrogenase